MIDEPFTIGTFDLEAIEQMRGYPVRNAVFLLQQFGLSSYVEMIEIIGNLYHDK